MIIELTKNYEYCVKVGKDPITRISLKGERHDVKKEVAEHLIRLEVAKKV